MPYRNLNDETLVMLTLAGEQSAYEVLVNRYQKAVIASAFSVTHNVFLAEDTAQDAFVTAWIKLDTLNEPEKFASWVCRIAKNCGMNMLRQYRGFLSFDTVENYDVADEDSIDSEYEKEEENAELHRTVAGLSEKVKTIIHEQNSELGMTNKFLLKYVDAVAISFPDTSVNARKIVYTGNPCAEVDTSLKFDKSELKLSKNKKLVLIVMGSLGSKVISDKMKEILPKFNDKNYEILFITGKSYYDEFKSLKLNSNIFVIPFLDNLKKILKYVDVMVSRAGATTISEIIAYKIPSILIPSPHVTDNHQYKNALNLFDKNASLLIEEKNLNSDILIKNIEYLLYDKISVLKMKDNLKSMQIKGSASKIYNLIIELTGE